MPFLPKPLIITAAALATLVGVYLVSAGLLNLPPFSGTASDGVVKIEPSTEAPTSTIAPIAEPGTAPNSVPILAEVPALTETLRIPPLPDDNSGAGAERLPKPEPQDQSGDERLPTQVPPGQNIEEPPPPLPTAPPGQGDGGDDPPAVDEDDDDGGGSSNQSPVAANDFAAVARGSTAAINVLANDTDPDGDPIVITGVTQGANGTVTFSSSIVAYTHDGSDTTGDTFNYFIADPSAGADTATVTIQIIDTASGLDLLASSDSGRSDTDNITNDSTPTVVVEADTGILVRLYVDGVLADERTAASDVFFTSIPLADGPHEFTATLEGSDGIEGVQSPPLTVVIDTDAPVPPDQLSLTDATDTGASSSDEMTRNTAPTVEGQAESGVEVRLFAGGLLVGQTTAGSAWQIPIPPLADGVHDLAATAEDLAGNVSESSLTLAVTIDTLVPAVTIFSPTSGEVLEGDEQLKGSVIDGPVDLIFYNFDGGNSVGMPVDQATDEFDQALNFIGLNDGLHSLNVTADDLAGNRGSAAVSVGLQFSVPLFVTGHTPLGGATEVGVTSRPQVFFSAPIDPATITNANFHATAGGNPVPANIVVANDGRFAWLFFPDPLSSASSVQVTLDGSSILPLGGGSPLDADGDGNPAGVLTYSFTTVSLSPLLGTTLSGIVADPGPDGKPMTSDDFDPGPDGLPHTGDDLYLLPIAGVEVFLLGLESDRRVTGADGRFFFGAVPSGNVKVAIHGGTATSPPLGSYYPEMVMDANMAVGADNFVMPGMEAVYLPLLPLAILKLVNAATTTMIVADATSAPNLPPVQRQFLTIEVQPNSLIGPDGLPLSSGQVGISTVDPDLVRDMLPPGVLQHTFDITVQAPGISVFSTPAPMTTPNIFGLPPGTQQNFLSFDHTTGRLVIEGTGTVSADGLFVTTDPGTGITHPGWHGWTPPGTETDPSCKPSPLPDIDLPPIPEFYQLGSKLPIQDVLFSGAFDEPTPDVIWIFRNNRGLLEANAKPCSPANMRASVMQVTIKVTGPHEKFVKGLEDTIEFEIAAGSPPHAVRFDAFKLDEKSFAMDVLFGAKAEITIKDKKDSSVIAQQSVYIYRWADISDNDNDNSLGFSKTLNDGAGGITRTREFILDSFPEDHANSTPAGSFTSLKVLPRGTAPQFSVTFWRGKNQVSTLVYDPASVDFYTDDLEITTPNGKKFLKPLIGKGLAKTNIVVNKPELMDELEALSLGPGHAFFGCAFNCDWIQITPNERKLFDTKAERKAIAKAVEDRLIKIFDPISAGVVIGESSTSDNKLEIDWNDLPSRDGLYGLSVDGNDLVTGDLLDGAVFGWGPAVEERSNYNKPRGIYNFAQHLNRDTVDEGNAYPNNIIEGPASSTPEIIVVNPLSGVYELNSTQLANALAGVAAHELIHTLSVPHTAQHSGKISGQTQIIELVGGAATDTFTLTFNGFTTKPLDRDLILDSIRDALKGLETIGDKANVDVVKLKTADAASIPTTNRGFKIVFQESLKGLKLPPVTTGGATGALTFKPHTPTFGATNP